jgi:Kef-type K+ transport system membrane component KefB
MSFNFNILLYLGIALITARFLGEIFERMKLSSILGELFAGFLFGGPIFSLLKVYEFNIGGSHPFNFAEMKESIEPFAQIGILLLLFIVGAEIKTSELRRAGRRNFFISLTDVSITYGLGFLFSYVIFTSTSSYHLIEGPAIFGVSAFFALIFVPTSIGTTVRTLSNMKRLNTKEGQTLLSLAVFDDFLGLFMLLVVSSIMFSGNTIFGLSPVLSVLIQILFIGVLLAIILFLLPKLLEFLENRFNFFSLPATSYFSIGIVLALLLILAYFAEYLGVSAAIGAFLLGIGMQRNRYLMSETLETFTKIGEGSFIPLFFFSVGSSFVLTQFNPIFLVVIPLIIFSKALGAFTGAMFSTNPLKDFIRGMRKRYGETDIQEEKEVVKERRSLSEWWDFRKPDFISSGRIAVGMLPKGEITLVIAAIGLNAISDIFITNPNAIAFGNDLYSVVILLVLVTVFLTPILLRLAFRTPKTRK